MAPPAEIETVRDLIDRLGTRQPPAYVSPARATDYSGAAVATAVRKAANLLPHYGVGRGRSLSVVVGPREPGPESAPGWLDAAADPFFAILGGLVLGAPVDPAPEPPVETAALVVPTAWLDRYPVGPGSSVLAYGDRPSEPTVAHFERERWSENPVTPPESITAAAPALRDGDTVYTHRALLRGVGRLGEHYDVAGADRVELRTAIDRPAALVAGVLAPLAVGTPIRPVPGVDSPGRRGVVLVSDGTERRIDLTGVLTAADRPTDTGPGTDT